MYKFLMKYLNFKVVVALIIAIILLGFSYNFLRPKEQIISSLDMFESKKMVSYVKDNKLYFINSQGKSILLYDKAFKDNNDSEIKISYSSYYINHPYCVFTEKDTGIYFLADVEIASNSGTLYRYDKNKGIKKIDEQVKTPIYVSSDCKKIAYLKCNGKNINNLAILDLYIYENSKTSVKILENSYAQGTYNFSWKTNAVAYTEINTENGMSKIYIKKQFKEKELVDEGMSLYTVSYSDDSNIIAYGKLDSTLQTNDYYIKRSGKKPEHIVASNSFQLIPKNFSAYYIGDYDKSKQSGNLYYKGLNKVPVKIAAEVINIFFDEPIYNDNVNSLKEKRILFQKSNGMVFWIEEKKAPRKMCNLKTDERLIFDKSAAGFIIISQVEGKIKRGIYDKAKHSYIIKDIEDNATVLLQSNVFESNKLFYTKRSTNYDYEFWCLDLSSNKKELIQTVSKNASTELIEKKLNPLISLRVNYSNRIIFPEVIGNTLYYGFYNGIKTEIYIKKFASKAIKICETNGSFMTYDEDTIYYSDSSGESTDTKYNLYVYKYGKGSELVASGISRLNLSN